MAAPSYYAETGAAVALSAATAKTVIGVKSGAAFGLILKEAIVTLDGTSASAVPGLVELCYCTWATNAPGTNSTTITPIQAGGRALTHGVTAARTWTTEPTVLTPIAAMNVHPQGGLVYQIPMSDEFDCALAEGFAIRCNFAAAVNVRAWLKWARA